MAILYNSSMRSIICGPPTREREALISGMAEYGTTVDACVWTDLNDTSSGAIPCYMTVEEAQEHHDNIEVAIVLTPEGDVREAAIEAIESKIGLTIILPRFVPAYDCCAIAQAARASHVNVLGPGSRGVLNPGIGLAGTLPLWSGFPPFHFLQPGPMAIISRSVAIGLSLLNTLKKGGVGVSTLVHPGDGDYIMGLSIEDILYLFENDEQTFGAIVCPRQSEADFRSIRSAVERGKFSKPLIVLSPEQSAMRDLRCDSRFDEFDLEKLIQELHSAGITVIHTCDTINDTVREKVRI